MKNTGHVHIARHSTINLGISRCSTVHYSEMRTACPTQERDTSPQMVSCALCCSHLVRNPTWFHSAPPNLNMYIKPESFLLSFISTLNIFNKCFSSSQACSCPSLRAPSYKLQKLLAEWRERNKAFEQTVQILVHSLGCWLSAKEWRNWGCSWLFNWITDSLTLATKRKKQQQLKQRKTCN